MRNAATAALMIFLSIAGCNKPNRVEANTAARESRTPEPPEQATPEPTMPEPEPSAEPSEDELAMRRDLESVLALSGSHSTSRGSPNAGRLEGGVALPLRGPGFRHNPLRNEEARFGTVETVQALIRAAMEVAEAFPNSELTINDLGYSAGGPIAHHGSHQSGRDVDVLFYFRDANDAPIPGKGVFVDTHGHGVDFGNLADPSDDADMHLDVPRTWHFVQALLEDELVEVQRFFVVEHVRSMLLAYARESDAPPDVIERFADMTCQPSYPHDDHFHIRFFCTPEDVRSGCQDTTPLYPWHLSFLREHDTRPNRADPRIRHRAPVTTHAQARTEAGEMHERVQEWLTRREAWQNKPRVNRTYCR